MTVREKTHYEEKYPATKTISNNLKPLDKIVDIGRRRTMTNPAAIDKYT